jgi:predicted metal-dependent phosphotriesterase family hydrolase
LFHQAGAGDAGRDAARRDGRGWAGHHADYIHITDDVLPALREHGVDEAQITAMLVRNPARYFTGGQE